MTEIQKGKYLFGTVKIGERGQIVIPVSYTHLNKTFRFLKRNDG